MVLFIILGAIVVVTLVVLGIFFYLSNKEGGITAEKVVPLTDLNQLKKELSSGLLEPQKPKTSKVEPGIAPPFEPKPVSPVSQGPLQMQGEARQLSLENEVYKKRAQELEEELRAISQKADGQSNEARQMIETLTKENESLKGQQAVLEQAQQNLLESANAKVRLLEEEISAVKIQMGEEIGRANMTVSELEHEKEAFLAAANTDSEEAMRHELEALKIEHIQFQQKYESLERANQDMQYELIKARAQSSGLERVSFNYKNQLEDFFKKVNAVQGSNDHLSQVKNRLEGMVQEVQLQNEELVKKDQLAQFELEKNRSRLANLEREYEDLKARVQQKNSK